MQPQKSRQSWYVYVSILFFMLLGGIIANNRVVSLVDHFSDAIFSSFTKYETSFLHESFSNLYTEINKKESVNLTPYFNTIIANPDQVATCSNDGATLARFNLCGNFDNRVIRLNQTYGTYEWQQLSTDSCPSFNIDEECPTYTCTGFWVAAGNEATLRLDANTISASNGAEFRVRVDGGSYFYFKVKKSVITQTFVKRNFICGVDGRIQITNLSSAYEYAIDNGTGFGPWQGAIFEGLQPGTYVVKARLRNTPNTCEYPYEPIIIESREIDIDVTFTDAQCFGENGSIGVLVNNVPGPFRYTLLDSNGFPQEFTNFIASNTYTFAAVGFGRYSIQVETIQCRADIANGIAAPRQDVDVNGNPIVIGQGLVALAASTEVNSSFGCSTISSVPISIRTSGGAAPYSFTVNGLRTASSPYTNQIIYTATSPGDYNFLITDANGCSITAQANVRELSEPVVTATGVNGTCTNGGARINFNVRNARGYNLSFRTNPADPWVNTPQIAVSDGTFRQLEVRYEQGSFFCTLMLPPVTVSSEATVTGTVSKLSDETCIVSGGTLGGRVQFGTPSGGSGTGYEFSLDGVNYTSNPLFTNLSAGAYRPIIRDDSGCRQELSSIVINPIDPPSDLDFMQTNINCALGTTNVQLIPTSNAGIVNYSIVAPTTFDNGSSDTFIGLNTATTYTFRIQDSNGCSYTESFTPRILSSIRVRARAGGDTRVCNGASDGNAAFIVDGFGSSYTYQINLEPVSTTQNTAEVNLVSRSAGTYTITVTDTDTGCTDSTSITIQESAVLALNPLITPMTCANNNTGRVVANTVGGWGGNRFTLLYPDGSRVGPRNSATFGNLTMPSTIANPYRLSVVDSEGCTASFEFQLSPLDSPTLSIASSNVCYEPISGASVTVVASGGSPTYSYRIDGGTYQASPIFTNISPGSHTIQVRDANNCTDALSLVINRPLRVTAAIETEIPCGGSPGQIRVNIANGYLANTSPKQYQVSTDNGVSYGSLQPFTANSFLIPVTVGGNYVFRVTDNENCEAFSEPLEVLGPVNILATAELIPASCSDPNSGGVRIVPNAISGIPPFEIDFGNTGVFTAQTVYTGLTAGQSYNYTVRDARGCVTMGLSATIPTSPNAAPNTSLIAVNANCSISGTTAGSIQVTGVTDGTPNFTYIVADVFGNEIIRVGPTASTSVIMTHPALIPGNYTVRTVDALGCIDIDTVTIAQTELNVVPDAVTPLCNVAGFSNTISIVGGIGPFLIRLIDDPNPPVTPNLTPRRHTFNGLQLGVTYTVEVTDLDTGCIYLEEIPPVDAPTDLEITASSPPVFCDDFGNGRVDFTVSQFLGPNLIIDLIDPLTNAILQTDLPTGLTGGASSSYMGSFVVTPGNYRLRVTDTDTCTDAASVDVVLNTPVVDVISNIPANCNALGQLTVRGSGGDGGPYTYAFVPAGNPVDRDGTITPTDPSDDFYTRNTAVLAGSLTGITYDIWVMDGRGCTFNVSDDVVLLQPALPAPTIIVDNQCAASASSFNITATMPAWVNTPSFTLNGESRFGIFNSGLNVWEVSYTVATPGTYTVDVVDANGCIGTGNAEVFEFLSGTGEFTALPTCNNPNGTITVITNGGSGNFSFELQDTLGNAIGGTPINTTGIFTNQIPGNYRVLVTDNLVNDGAGFCSFIVPVNLDSATLPIIGTEIVENISCNSANDGSITITLQAGTEVDSPINYILTNISTSTVVSNNATGVFNGLSEGDYQVEVITNRGCAVLSSIMSIINPPIFEISAVNTPFTCEIGANRFSSSMITVNVDQLGTLGSGYQYSITGHENYQSSNTFEIIDNGSVQNITVYAIDGNGCRAEFILPAITPPSTVQPNLVVESPINCEDPEIVRITVTGTTDFTVETTSATPIAAVSNTLGSSFVTINLPSVGEYLFVVRDNLTGCLYPMPRHTVIAPTIPTINVRQANPIQCFSDTNGALFVNVTDYVGEYTFEVFRSDDLLQTNLITSGNFNTTNFPDVNGDDARITGLPGGNFYVRIRAIDLPKCSITSDVVNIAAPNGTLTVTAEQTENVSCVDNAGIIVANGIGGWDSSPYQYRLLKEDSLGGIARAGVSYSEVVPFGFDNQFWGLYSGNYSIEIRDIEQCLNAVEISLAPIDPIVVGIRETQGLVCPDGNNAILEAFNPATGNRNTAVAGARGGVTDAGYKYQLLYLNSNDSTDISSRSGLQDTPTFDGDTGGFISAGWYAIQVFSSFECAGVSAPYLVVPPPPIDPKLVQVRAPGCGGRGQMRLTIENPEPGYSYEYRSISAAESDPFIPIIGNSVLIDGVQGFYQYDVRKTGGAGACTSLRSEGITLVDAQDIALVANLPDDISCATENDGRIESFASGGIGNELYTLYLGNPTPPSSTFTAFNPDPAAQVVRAPQNNGTFENLSEGVYYIGVTSGLSCGTVEGPLIVSRPDPILYTITTSNISCNGERDGSITIDIISGGEGLVQFAINPNFNEFFSDPENPTSYTFENLGAGANYQILIKDDKGCGELVPVRPITEPDNLAISNIITQPEICLNALDGQAQVVITGGTPFVDTLTSIQYYETRIEGPGFNEVDPMDPNLGFVRNDNLLFENLQGGASYRIFVRDQNGCTSERQLNIGLGVDLASQAVPQYGCEGIFPTNTVTIEMEDDSLIPEVLFSLNINDIANANATRTFGDLEAGEHTVYIYHSNGCMDMVNFMIDEYLPLSLAVSKTGPNEITALASGGFGNYLYSFQGGQASVENVFNTTMDGNVIVRVEDERGCVAMVTLPFDFDTMVEIPNFFTPDGDNFNDTWAPRNREFFPFIEVKIYDRYGRVVALLDQITTWDGTYEGRAVPTGDYWYVVNANDEDKQQYVGHFTLYR